MFKITFLFFLLLANLLLCNAQTQIITGAAQWESYKEILGQKNIGIVAHQASLVNSKTHLIDTLLSLKVNIKKVFAPEHGFRGDADAGERVVDQKDPKTGLPILSLYGNNKKPSKESLEGISIMIFDLQ